MTNDTYDNFEFRDSNFKIFPPCSMPYAFANPQSEIAEVPGT